MPTTTQYESGSDEMQEIIGYVPNWITRWGICVVFALVSLILYLSQYIRFPDTLMANVELSAREQPYKVSWFKSDQYLVYSTKVTERQIVKEGDSLLVERDMQKNTLTVVRSPFVGKVFFTKGYKENNNKQTIWVVPKIRNFDVLVKLPIKKSGKVRPGQRVQINLNEYPANEFGLLQGKVESIIPIKIENTYRVRVNLSNGLTTTTGVSIPEQVNFSGTAEIISDPKSLFQRIFGSLL